MLYLYSCELVPLELSDRCFVICRGKCQITEKPYSVTITLEGYNNIGAGQHIQDALPFLSKGDREFLITGVSPEGWKIFADSDNPYYRTPEIITKEKDIRKINIKWKLNWEEFKETVVINKVLRLYHFTSLTNLQSIIRSGGLYSWGYSDENSIPIPITGGNALSKTYDKEANLHDYVRLSFVEDHPMKYVQRNRLGETVILEINPEVCYLQETIFTNMNATSKNVSVFKDIDSFKALRFSIFKLNYKELSEIDKKHFQSEVMIKSFLDIKYITNINSFKL